MVVVVGDESNISVQLWPKMNNYKQPPMILSWLQLIQELLVFLCLTSEYDEPPSGQVEAMMAWVLRSVECTDYPR